MSLWVLNWCLFRWTRWTFLFVLANRTRTFGRFRLCNLDVWIVMWFKYFLKFHFSHFVTSLVNMLIIMFTVQLVLLCIPMRRNCAPLLDGLFLYTLTRLSFQLILSKRRNIMKPDTSISISAIYMMDFVYKQILYIASTRKTLR